MDIYDYLKLDHQRVNELFKQFEVSDLLVRKKQIVLMIAQELLVHAHSEQETFYKELKKFDTAKDEALHGQEEHQEIEDQINIILHSKESDSGWIKKVEKLKELVQHHVKEEEGPIFKRAKKVLSDKQAYILKEQMHYLKQRFLLYLQKESEREDKMEDVPEENISKIKKSLPKEALQREPKSPKIH